MSPLSSSSRWRSSSIAGSEWKHQAPAMPPRWRFQTATKPETGRSCEAQGRCIRPRVRAL